MNSTRFYTIGLVLGMVALGLSPVAMADGFGSGVNQFDIDFVTISGDTNPASGWGIVNNDYRMGTYEITNEQWDAFCAIVGNPVGDPPGAYDNLMPDGTVGRTANPGENVPVGKVSWYEAAQFVNWLNTSGGHHAAYNFTGDQGTGNYAPATWSYDEAYGGTNLYRHKDAFYFLPTEDEWVKAAYWNGQALQTYATKDDDLPVQGVDALYRDDPGITTGTFWPVGSGTEELNGSYDMVGNIWEWMENPLNASSDIASGRVIRGASLNNTAGYITSSDRLAFPYSPDTELYDIGFRVASVPEPATLGLLSLGGLALLKQKKEARR
jgi:formylglycine-generating enzyme required for sulfatase activity